MLSFVPLFLPKAQHFIPLSLWAGLLPSLFFLRTKPFFFMGWACPTYKARFLIAILNLNRIKTTKDEGNMRFELQT